MINNAYNKPDTKLGFIGLGLMGSRFLRRLNAEGWNVRGWNRSSAATLPLKEYGFAIDDTLADLVPRSDVLLSSLANDDAARAIYLGQNGVFTNVQPETTILEMSTISPDLSALLHQEARRRGAEMIDLPVSGSTPAVDSGTVTLFAGGERETFNRCIPIFESIAKQWYLMGPATAGVRMKLVANLLLGVNMEAIAEAVSLGEHLQLNRALLLDVLPKTAVIAPAFLGKFQKIKVGDYSPQFPLHLMSKDMNLVHSAANRSGAVLPATSATNYVFEDALAEKGGLDLSAVTTYVQTLAQKETPIG
ncbi:NAD(P)-dependent oxidoreductase [Edaphobacter aggregans]|uniref:NAD(P)-dependent oxidoreductase n=1 Tax=Edaphobacter aggregans TaxID=570835 RepID=UPI0005553A3C|nr:NAD(P)-dependent oxidoreductase [Edaphobacter aggregans]